MDVLGVPAVVRQPLTEEEVELGVVGIRAVRDQVGIDKDRLWVTEMEEMYEGIFFFLLRRGCFWALRCALCILTTQPLGVVLVAAHGVPLSQAPEDGGISAHEVDVHAGEEFLVWRMHAHKQFQKNFCKQVSDWLLLYSRFVIPKGKN